MLHEAIADLGHAGVMAFNVTDGMHEGDRPKNPVDELARERWAGYDAQEMSRAGSRSFLYFSRRAELEHPGHDNVRIRVDLKSRTAKT